jgi:hypothetical protein
MIWSDEENVLTSIHAMAHFFYGRDDVYLIWHKDGLALKNCSNRLLDLLSKAFGTQVCLVDTDVEEVKLCYIYAYNQFEEDWKTDAVLNKFFSMLLLSDSSMRLIDDSCFSDNPLLSDFYHLPLGFLTARKIDCRHDKRE